jgi:tetratricopeptide (TPR) repeat protein
VVLRFIGAPTWAATERIVRDKRDDLLTDAADAVTVKLLGYCRSESQATELLEDCRALLRRCRQEGIDHAFAELVEYNASKPDPIETSRKLHLFSVLLTSVNRAIEPFLWAALQVALGSAYSDYPIQDGDPDDEQAIQHYRLAWQVFTVTAFPEEWAATQYNLGRAFTYRVVGETAENMEQAIHCYEQALEVYTRTGYPIDWADTQYVLGNAVKDRSLGQRAENLEQALGHYRLALEIHTREGRL